MRQKGKDSGQEKRKWNRLSPIVGIVALVVAFALYTFRGDAIAAVTVWPAWTWSFVGVLATLFSSRLRPVLFAGWALFSLLFVEETWSFPRSFTAEPTSNLRIVTLNCAGGSILAAEEVIKHKPDVILLQESPSAKELEDFALKVFGPAGKVVRGPDASIISRGRMSQVDLGSAVNNCVAAVWSPSITRSLNLVSLRLQPPVMRVDLYNPDAWREFAQNRASRREEIKQLSQKLAAAGFRADVIGGDFNTPPDRGVLAPLTKGMTDAFGAAGVGYGATCVNPFPCLVRIDQVWTGSELKLRRARVVKTEQSDHRMLVVDLDWGSGER